VVLCVSLGVVVLGEVVLGVVLCVLLGLVLWLGFC
jgi:fructose-1,6-bisphosphatase/inositol monophosphatase family enzyme